MKQQLLSAGVDRQLRMFQSKQVLVCITLAYRLQPLVQLSQISAASEYAQTFLLWFAASWAEVT